MFGFVRTVEADAPAVPKKLSDAMFEASYRYKQSHFSFYNGNTMCALGAAYAMVWGAPWWMGATLPYHSKSPDWKDLPTSDKVGMVAVGIFAMPVALAAVGVFMTRLKLHYKVPYSTLMKLSSQNDNGASFRDLGQHLRAKGY